MDEKERESYIARLKECQENHDDEKAHADANQILCDILTKAGYQDIVSEWDRVRKYYA